METVNIVNAPSEHDSQRNARSWYYIDDDQLIQGPFLATTILSKIFAGTFDGKGVTPFASTKTGPFKPLTFQIERMLNANLDSVLERLKPEEAAPSQQDEDPSVQKKTLNKPTTAEETFELPQDLDIVTSENTQKLYKSFRTSDMDLVIVPESEQCESHLEEPSMLNKCCVSEANTKHNPATSIRSEFTSICLCVHSSLLKIASPFFMKEIFQIEQKWKNDLKNDPHSRLGYRIGSKYPEALRLVIRYIYGFSIESDTADPLLLISVIKEAQRLSMPRLVEKCIETLSKPRDIHTMVALATAAEICQFTSLMQEVVADLANCAFSLFSDGSYLQLGPEGFRCLLESDSIQLDETQIFHCTFIWLLQHPSVKLPVKTHKTNQTLLTTSGSRNQRDASFDDKRVYWKSPKDGKDQSDFVLRLLAAIRFCSMSPKQIRDIRLPYMDSLLLDGMIRKAFAQELPTRVFPWKGNEVFSIKCYEGLFPVTLCRRASSMADNTWAWTTGHVRWISEAAWAIEVISCFDNQLNIGVVVERNRGDTNLSSTALPTMQHNNTAFYFNCADRSFNTGCIDKDPRSVTYRVKHTKVHANTWKGSISKGDIIFVRITATRSSLFVSIRVLTRNEMVAEHMFPHSTSATKRGKYSSRYGVRLAPYLECFSNSDIYGVPELQANVPGAAYA